MIYLDNAATTRIDEAVLEKMLPYLTDCYGNAQSQYSLGRKSAAAITKARDEIAAILGCTSEEIFFVSGGTEAGNTALKGVALANKSGKIVLSSIEHPSLIEAAKDMSALGFQVEFIEPNSDGVVSLDSVKKAVDENTIFCAVMAANNETGVIQPVEEIGEFLKSRGVFYYCDCVQIACEKTYPTAFCDALGISAHKFHGPKGVGVLYLKSRNRLARLVSGGMQEHGFRGGTSNVAAIVGMAEALKKTQSVDLGKIKAMRDRFLDRVLGEIDGTHLNGHRQNRVAANANISFDGCDGQNLLFLLDLKNIAVSTGSACSAGAVSPSHVLTSMLGEDRAKSAVRFTFGKYNTQAEVDTVVDELKTAVEKIRAVKS